jgi:hypothetical protein
MCKQHDRDNQFKLLYCPVGCRYAYCSLGKCHETEIRKERYCSIDKYLEIYSSFKSKKR